MTILHLWCKLICCPSWFFCASNSHRVTHTHTHTRARNTRLPEPSSGLNAVRFRISWQLSHISLTHSYHSLFIHNNNRRKKKMNVSFPTFGGLRAREVRGEGPDLFTDIGVGTFGCPRRTFVSVKFGRKLPARGGRFVVTNKVCVSVCCVSVNCPFPRLFFFFFFFFFSFFFFLSLCLLKFDCISLGNESADERHRFCCSTMKIVWCCMLFDRIVSSIKWLIAIDCVIGIGLNWF